MMSRSSCWSALTGPLPVRAPRLPAAARAPIAAASFLGAGDHVGVVIAGQRLTAVLAGGRRVDRLAVDREQDTADLDEGVGRAHELSVRRSGAFPLHAVDGGVQVDRQDAVGELGRTR